MSGSKSLPRLSKENPPINTAYPFAVVHLGRGWSAGALQWQAAIVASSRKALDGLMGWEVACHLHDTKFTKEVVESPKPKEQLILDDYVEAGYPFRVVYVEPDTYDFGVEDLFTFLGHDTHRWLLALRALGPSRNIRVRRVDRKGNARIRGKLLLKEWDHIVDLLVNVGFFHFTRGPEESREYVAGSYREALNYYTIRNRGIIPEGPVEKLDAVHALVWLIYAWTLTGFQCVKDTWIEYRKEDHQVYVCISVGSESAGVGLLKDGHAMMLETFDSMEDALLHNTLRTVVEDTPLVLYKGRARKPICISRHGITYTSWERMDEMLKKAQDGANIPYRG